MLQKIINSEWFSLGVAVWVIISILFSKQNVFSIFQQARDIIKIPLNATNTGVNKLAANTPQVQQQVHDVNKELVKVIKEVVNSAKDNIDTFTKHVVDHFRYISMYFSKDESNRFFYAFMSLFELIFLILFIYTDASQAANSLITLLPDEKVPEILGDLFIPLIISSAGSAFILGVILAELKGITHFSIWGSLEQKTKNKLFRIVLATLILSILCSLSLSLNRFPELLEVNATQEIDPNDPTRIITHNSAQISEWWRVGYLQVASFSQSFIIIPLLITTVLLFNAVKGFLVIYLLFLVIPLLILLKLLSVFLVFLKIIIDFGGMGGDIASKIIFFLLINILGILGTVLLGTINMANHVENMLEHMVDGLTRPANMLGQGLQHTIQKIPWFKEKTPNPIPQTIEEMLGNIANSAQPSTGSPPSQPGGSAPTNNNGGNGSQP
jgi:hypothetical protein